MLEARRTLFHGLLGRLLDQGAPAVRRATRHKRDTPESIGDAASGFVLGATGWPQPSLQPAAVAPCDGLIDLVVVGAHLSGMPLNGELKALGARLLEATSTAPDYRLYALSGSNPPKPGMLAKAGGSRATRWLAGGLGLTVVVAVVVYFLRRSRLSARNASLSGSPANH